MGFTEQIFLHFHFSYEWYFLCQYAMLKAVPNKNAGFIILLTSIFTLFFFGEIRNLTTFTRLMDYNNGFSISSFFLSFLSFLWIGAQFPQEKFLSYGRILTLHYYFLLMCILFSLYFSSAFQKRFPKKLQERVVVEVAEGLTAVPRIILLLFSTSCCPKDSTDAR